VSCSVVRRVALPDAFLAIDGLFETFLTVLVEFGAYPAVIERELARYLPFLAPPRCSSPRCGRASAARPRTRSSRSTPSPSRSRCARPGRPTTTCSTGWPPTTGCRSTGQTSTRSSPTDLVHRRRARPGGALRRAVAEVTGRYPAAARYRPARSCDRRVDREGVAAWSSCRASPSSRTPRLCATRWLRLPRGSRSRMPTGSTFGVEADVAAAPGERLHRDRDEPAFPAGADADGEVGGLGPALDVELEAFDTVTTPPADGGDRAGRRHRIVVDAVLEQALEVERRVVDRELLQVEQVAPDLLRRGGDPASYGDLLHGPSPRSSPTVPSAACRDPTSAAGRSPVRGPRPELPSASLAPSSDDEAPRVRLSDVPVRVRFCPAPSGCAARRQRPRRALQLAPRPPPRRDASCSASRTPTRRAPPRTPCAP
jgi:hypothetical protein